MFSRVWVCEGKFTQISLCWGGALRLGVGLSHLLCEIFRPGLCPFLSTLPRMSWTIYSRPDNYYIINSSGVQKCNVIFIISSVAAECNVIFSTSMDNTRMRAPTCNVIIH